MPLKHLTETVLVVLLALVTIAAGVASSVLPPIPEGFIPWAIVFVAALVYPAILYPILKGNRADYSFRALHFAPVALALGWVSLQIVILKEPRAQAVHDIYTWGFGVVPVATMFFLLAVFCLQVIRRRVPRITFMILLLAPFAVAAYVSETRTHWDAQLASLLWTPKPVEVAEVADDVRRRGPSSMLAASSRGEKNLSLSSVPDEEAWRQKLRSVEQGSVHATSVGGTLKGVNAALNLAVSEESGAVVGTRRIAKKPRMRLPKSGGETEAIGIAFLALFAGTLHARGRRRLTQSSVPVR